MSEAKPKRTYIKRNFIERGALSNLTPTEYSRKYRELAGRIERYCEACNKNIERSAFTRHLKTNKHKLNEEIVLLKAKCAKSP